MQDYLGILKFHTIRTKAVYRVLQILTSRHENCTVKDVEKYYFPYDFNNLASEHKIKMHNVMLSGCSKSFRGL